MKKFYLFLLFSTFLLNKTFATNPPCSVQAGFTTAYVNNQLNVVQCFNTSVVDSTSVVYSIWNFGDGTAPVNTSGLSQPSHTYTTSGLYNICLKVISVVPGTTSVTCADSICHQIQVQTPVACSLVANFTSSATSAANTFAFVNTSTGFAPGDSIRWTFGDGTVSYDVNPTHTFANYGTYNVCLRIQKYPTAGAPPCVSEVCYAITIVNPNPCSIVPNFSISPATNTNNAFVFSNLSTPTSATATWNFGDSTTGAGNIVTHAYTHSGVYRVCMTVIVNNTCIRDTCMNLTVNITPPPTTCNVHAGFSTSYVNNQLNVIQCLNASSVDSMNTVYSIWNFGDGTPATTTSGLTQPTHTYTTSGLYNICLKVISVVPGTNINCSDSICHQVQVQAPTTCTLVSNFTTSTSSNVVSFQNTSTGFAAGDSIRWTFGDGSVSYDVSPTHTFANPGTYTVCLRIRKNPTPAGAVPCVSEVCHTVTITASNPCSLYPNFTASVSPNASNVYVFTNTSTSSSPTASVTWNFGDSTFGSGNVTTHTYAQSGVYHVCMTVVVNNTCIRDTCINITVTTPVPTPCSIAPRFSVVASQSQPGLFTFNNTSIATTAMSVVWNFGDSTTATGNSVSHIYTHSGTYQVCMIVSTNNNTCVRDTCGTIVVNIPTPTPCSVAPRFSVIASQSQPGLYFFSNTSNTSSGVTAVTWNFGDSTTATGNNVSHTFTHSGTYNVCMHVSLNNNSCAGDTCGTVVVNITTPPPPPPTACNLMPSFTYSRSTSSNNTFEFINTSAGMSSSALVTWTFGDGTTDTGNIVHHTYTQSGGGYYVCMRVQDSACTRSTCRYVSTANYLQAYPNPALTNVNVNINLSQATPIYAYIYNSQGMLVGQLLQQGMQGNNLLTFNVAGLPAGYYTIRIYTANGVFISRFQKL